MGRLLSDHGERLGPATFRGALYDVGPYPAALASDDPADRIHGEVHRIREARALEVLQRLDRYEGCPGGEAGDALYVRHRHEVTLEDGTALEAWVWLWNRPLDGIARIPGGDWLAHLEARGAP